MKIEIISNTRVLKADEGYLIMNTDKTLAGGEIWLGLRDNVENYIEIPEAEAISIMEEFEKQQQLELESNMESEI